MNLRLLLIVLIVVIAIIMIYISYNSGIPAPALTGVGFLIIAIIFFQEKLR